MYNFLITVISEILTGNYDEDFDCEPDDNEVNLLTCNLSVVDVYKLSYYCFASVLDLQLLK